MRRTTTLAISAALAAGLALTGVGSAFASGGSSGGGGGGGSGSGATAPCLTMNVNPASIAFFGGGKPRVLINGTVTNCGTSALALTGVTTDIGTHADPACALGSSSYHLTALAAGATAGWFQSTIVVSCMSEYDVIRVDMVANNVVLATQTVTQGIAPVV